jgi:uncharacterized membrane protein (TIGR02234 family)
VTPDRRTFRLALLLLAVGAAMLLLGYARPWATALVRQEGLPTVTFELTGREIEPAGAAAAVLALAGIAGLIAMRAVGRVVSGAVLLVAGLGAAAGAVLFGAGSGSRAEVVRLVSDRVGLDVEPTVSTTSWWLSAVVGGLLVAAAGALAVARGRRWPQLGRRYERDGGAGPAGPAGPRPSSAASAPVSAGATAAWDALDQGIDPTLDPPGPDHVAPGGTATGTMTPTDAQEDPR